MEIVTLANKIITDWALLIFFFTLGGIWWQIKAWFNKVNSKMEEFVGVEWFETVERRMSETAHVHEQQNQMLIELTNKIINIEERVERIDTTLTKVHEEVHEQEIKIAVLESQPRRVAQ